MSKKNSETLKIKACGGDRVKNLEAIAAGIRQLVDNAAEAMPGDERHQLKGYAEQLLIIAKDVKGTLQQIQNASGWIETWNNRIQQSAILKTFNNSTTETGRFSGTQPNESNTLKEHLSDTTVCSRCLRDCNSDTAEQYKGQTVCERCWNDLCSGGLEKSQ